LPVRRSKVDLAGKPATEKHAILRKSRRFMIFQNTVTRDA
jgi:hypothetical protein